MVAVLLANGSVIAIEQDASSEETIFSESTVENASADDELPETVPSILMETLNPDTFAGIYKDSSGYHIQTNDKEAVQRSVARIRSADTLNLEYSDAQYSLSELRDAKEIIWDSKSGCNITAVGIDVINNAVFVATTDLSEENKARIQSLSTVDNVVFGKGGEIYSGIPDGDNADGDNSIAGGTEEPMATATKISVYGGNWCSKTPGGAFSSIATSVRSTNSTDSSKGFITCGHGWTKGENVYWNKTSTQLGTIKRRDVSEFCDASFITSTQTRTGETYDGRKIAYQGNPIPGDTVYIIGARSNQEEHRVQTSKVTAIDVIATPVDTGVKHTNLFTFESNSWIGDSGCAILTSYAGDYAISGIQTAHMETTGGSGTAFSIKWNDVKRTLDITAVSK